MRFLLYNIRYGAGIGTDFHFPLPYSGYIKPSVEHLERITNFILSVKPDIVGLVEVDAGSFRSGKRSQPAALAEALGHFQVYHSKYANQWLAQRFPLLKNQGNAFLTSKEIRKQQFHYFRNGVKRLVIEMELEELTVMLVHLSLKFRHRHYQLWELFSLVKQIQKPLILAGDFNALRGTREVQLFLAATGLQSANVENLPTYPSWAPRRQLDFVLHSPEIRIRKFGIPDIKLSDHLPVVCDFEIQRRAASDK
ncbi:MAG: endonuclease/exonuclease/phosphatase family protein [Candidatus Hydrogenedentes bacterium]|nr:endonuclease/exonuclease/phosphatase family protein [Candidatus Hydrogenedentota bacterium]